MTTDPAAADFESRLTEGTARFIAHMFEHSFAIGRRTSRDFLRHFPPQAIMDALRDLPSLRADILESTTGVKRKIALKKSAASAASVPVSPARFLARTFATKTSAASAEAPCGRHRAAT